MASSSGTTVLILVGLIAVGFAASGDDSDVDTAGDSEEFSFEASASDSANDDLFDEPSGDDDDFSFEPDGGGSGSSTGDGDGDGDGGGGGGGSGCEDVVIVNEGSAEVDVPGESRIFQESTVECAMSEGDDGEAVAALQDALVRCNGQSITVDGEYGPATTQAVASVQARNGLTVDGTYGPATMRAMSWPSGDGCTEVA